MSAALRLNEYQWLIEQPGAERRKHRFDSYKQVLKVSNIADRLSEDLGRRFDANESLIFARQLEEIDTQLYEVQYPQFRAVELIPIRPTSNAAQTYTYRVLNHAGSAKIVANYGTDFPRVGAQSTEQSSKIESIGDSYGYSIQDVRAAAMANVPLEDTLARTAREAIAQFVDNVLWFGNTEVGLTGLANNSEVSLVTPINGNWATETDPNKILADLLKLEAAAYNATAGVEFVDSLLLPQVLFAKLSTTPLSALAPTVSILDYFKSKSMFVKNVEAVWRLNTANAAGTGPRAIVYRRDPAKIQGILPIEFEQFPPQAQALEFSVFCHARCGGVIIRYPRSAWYMDGI
jgi:hypothetical protein